MLSHCPVCFLVLQIAGEGPVDTVLFEEFESCSQKVAKCLPPIIDPEEWKKSAEHVRSFSAFLYLHSLCKINRTGCRAS